MLSVFICIPSYGIWVAEVDVCHPQSQPGLLQFLHALFVVLQVTGSLFLLTLFTLAVIADALNQRHKETDADAGPDAKKGGYEDVLNHFHCAAPLSQDRKSSSRSVAKSSAAEDLPPSGSPSRTFWMLPRPQAIPRLPLELKA